MPPDTDRSTEAEWEYAARGAVDPPDYLYSGSGDISAVAWHGGTNCRDGSARRDQVAQRT